MISMKITPAQAILIEKYLENESFKASAYTNPKRLVDVKNPNSFLSLNFSKRVTFLIENEEAEIDFLFFCSNIGIGNIKLYNNILLS